MYLSNLKDKVPFQQSVRLEGRRNTYNVLGVRIAGTGLSVEVKRLLKKHRPQLTKCDFTHVETIGRISEGPDRSVGKARAETLRDSRK